MKKRFCDDCGKEADLPESQFVAALDTQVGIGKISLRVTSALSGQCGEPPDLCRSCLRGYLLQIADKL